LFFLCVFEQLWWVPAAQPQQPPPPNIAAP